jgi:hypothetical protein
MGSVREREVVADLSRMPKSLTTHQSANAHPPGVQIHALGTKRRAERAGVDHGKPGSRWLPYTGAMDVTEDDET